MKRTAIILGATVAVFVAAAAVFGIAALRVEIGYQPNPDPGARVQPVRFGHANIYLIATETGHILVDAGMPGAPEKLDEVFAVTGVDPASVSLIVASHGHLDHIGLMAHAQRMTGAEIAAHPSVARLLRRGGVEEATPQNALGRFMNGMTAVLMLVSGAEIEPVEPGILVEDTLDLAAYGLPGRIVHTPGHSGGSLSILLDSGEALVGDLVRDEGSGTVGPGMFYADKEVLVASLERIADATPRVIYLSHGDRIGLEELTSTIATMRAE
jgi:glyoxylase-like metal-dependent hydrolase (beta-lactamase superfamily II)